MEIENDKIKSSQSEDKPQIIFFDESQQEKKPPGWFRILIEKLKAGWLIVYRSMEIFNDYPKFLVPLLFVWIIYAPIILYLKFWFKWNNHSTLENLLVLFAVVFIFAFILSLSCLMNLENISQMESGNDISITKSFQTILKHDMRRIFPIIIIWTAIWFSLFIIQIFLSKKNEDDESSEESGMEEAAEALVGYGSFSLSKAFFDALQKGIRMVIFLILPAIAWDGLNFRQAIKKGLAVFKTHLSIFVSGFILTELAATVIFLPPFLLMFITHEYKIHTSDSLWFLTILYIAFAWSYSIYLEQMFSAGLYLWHLKWEKEAIKAQEANNPLPKFEDVPQPLFVSRVSPIDIKKDIL